LLNWHKRTRPSHSKSAHPDLPHRPPGPGWSCCHEWTFAAEFIKLYLLVRAG
jgi:hypothetical protein